MAPCKENAVKTVKEGASLNIKGRGTVQLCWKDFTLQISNCFYLPEVTINLLSAGALNQAGCTLTAGRDTFSVTHNNSKIFGGSIVNNLYSIPPPAFDQNILKNYAKSCFLKTAKAELMKIHENFGHTSLTRLSPFIQHIPGAVCSNFQCINCISCNITKSSFNQSSNPITKVFNRIHLDLIGPLRPQSKWGCRFALTLVDNASGYLAAFPLMSKDKNAKILIDLIKKNSKREVTTPQRSAWMGVQNFSIKNWPPTSEKNTYVK